MITRASDIPRLARFLVGGRHIYNPKSAQDPLTTVASITVVASTASEADRFATAAFAMGVDGIRLIESLHGVEGYLIDNDGMATMTSGLADYL